jgi:DNA repair protein RadA
MIISEILEINKNQIVKKQKILKDFELKKNQDYVLPVGAKSFDEILRGGFYKGKKYLIFGANNTGKTQICHQLCVQACNKFSRITELKNQFIFYFDTENTFRPERLKELTSLGEVGYEKLLRSILVSRIMSNSAFLLSLKELEHLLNLNYINILIIDTLNNHYNSEIANKSYSLRKAKENFFKVLNKIDDLNTKYNLITVATAQVTSNLTREPSIRVIPVGNNLLNYFFSEYIYLDYREEDKRYVQLVNSMSLPEKRLPYKITSSGIQDYKV